MYDARYIKAHEYKVGPTHVLSLIPPGLVPKWPSPGSAGNSSLQDVSFSMSCSTAYNSSSSLSAGIYRSIVSPSLSLPLTLPQETNKKLASLNALKWSVWTSRGAGLTLAFDAGLLLVPMLRDVITVLRPKLVRFFPADENIWFHRQIAYSMAFWSVVHATAHYINFYNIELTRKSPPPPSSPPSSPAPYPGRGSYRDCPRHSVYPGRRHYRPLHAPHHAPHLHYCPPQNSSPVLRGILVHSPPRLLLLLGSLFTCYRLLRPRFRISRLHSNLPFLLHSTLSRLRELEVHHLARNRLLCGAHVPRIPCKESN